MAERSGQHAATMTAMSGVVVGLIAASIDAGSVATALPTIVDELGGLEQLPWVVTAYLLASTVVLPIYGGWSDAIGRKPLFLGALSIVVVGSALAATAVNVAWLIVARVVTGMGAGGLIILAQSMVADTVAPRQRSRYLGVLGAVFSIGNVIGPVVGGVITDRLGWRWTFLITIPLGVAAIAIAAKRLPAATARRHERSLDVTGAALLTSALTALVLAIVLGGGRLAWSSPLVVGLGALAVLLGTVLLRWEGRVERGVIPVRLLGGRDITLALLVAFITGTAIMGLIFFTPVFLQVAAGVSPTVSGVLMLPLMGGFMVSSVATGRIITRLGHYKPFPIAGTVILAVSFGLLGILETTTPLSLVAVYLAAAGIGVGMVMQVIILAVQNMVPSDAIGSATSVAQLFRAIGATVGVTAFGSVLTSRFLDGLAARGVGDVGVEAGSLLGDAAALDLLTPATREAVAAAAGDAVTFVFLLAVPICLTALVAAVAMRERPLLSEMGLD